MVTGENCANTPLASRGVGLVGGIIRGMTSGMTWPAPGSVWVKDPTDVAWYKFDWSEWLVDTTIAAYSVSVDANATKDGSVQQDADVFVQVSGGTDCTHSVVTCSITTGDGETFTTTKAISIRTRSS